MAFDGITVAALVEELRQRLLGGRITKIAQPETDELLLTIKAGTEQERLYLSACASLPLVYLTKENKKSPMTAPGFCMLLRKYIGNGKIIAIHQPGLERIINFDVEHVNEMGDLCRKRLVVEIMGKHSNIIFCDHDIILDSIKHVSAHMSSVREVLPGRPYFIPDTMSKQDPLRCDYRTFVEVLRRNKISLSKALYTGFTGISLVAAEDILNLAGFDSGISVLELNEDERLHLYRQLIYYMEKVSTADFCPTIYYRDGVPKEFHAFLLSTYNDHKTMSFMSVSQMLHQYYAEKKLSTRMHQKSAELRHVVQVALERARKKYNLQSKQMKDTEKRDRYRVYGELLNTYGYNLQDGARELTCLNYYTNKEITIPLDTTNTPQENAQRYFAKYNKQKRTFEALSKLIIETESDIRYLESIENALELAMNESDLAQIKEELMQSGYIRRRFAKKKVKIVGTPLHYLSSDGYHMYVGKNNLQNDELTFSLADAHDWWFHAKGVPGSHVIVRSNGDELPDAVFEEAGRLAAYYSKNRGSDKVEIDYVEKKHVKKPNGAKPGFVVYYTNYSLIIGSDITGIEQVVSEYT